MKITREHAKNLAREYAYDSQISIKTAIRQLTFLQLKGNIDPTVEHKLSTMNNEELLEFWADLYSC